MIKLFFTRLDLLGSWHFDIYLFYHLGHYFVNGSKSWLIVKKEEDVARAREIFGDQVNITKTQPQAAYAAFTKGFLSKFTYFLRTIKGFGDYTDGIQEIISHILVPTFFGNEAPFELHHLNLFSLPTSLGGLGIPFLKDEATQQYAASLSLTSPHVESIVAQDVELRETNCDKKTQNQLRSQLMSAKADRLKVKAVAVYHQIRLKEVHEAEPG